MNSTPYFPRDARAPITASDALPKRYFFARFRPAAERTGFRNVAAASLRHAVVWLILVSAAVPTSATARGVAGPQWVSTWVSAQQITEPHNHPPAPGLSGQSLRQVIQPTLGGEQVRVAVSNEFGDRPLQVDAASIAVSLGGSTIATESARPVRFGGQAGVTVQPGTRILSDPVELRVVAFENLAVTLFLADVPPVLTGHPGSRTTSYFVAGEHVLDAEFLAPTVTDHWYVLSGVEVLAVPAASAIVIIGDSITDGRGSTTNLNDRWPNVLARRLHARPSQAPVAVLNQGIGGGRVLRDGLGPSALSRFDRDVLGPPGVTCVVIFKGVNDLGTAVGARQRGQPAASADDLIAGYRQMIMRARSHGLRVIGATIMPFAGFTSYDTPESEADRQAVNAWIRGSGEFDAVIDFDAITRIPDEPSRLSPAVDGGDHLHPSAEGYRLMAEAIDLTIFE